MASFNLPISSLGSQTAPAQMGVTLSAILAKYYRPGVRCSFAPLADLGGVVMANGVDPLRLAIGGSVYDVGLLPPDPVGGAPTATPDGARATATLNTSTDTIGNNYELDGFVVPGLTVRFVNNLTPLLDTAGLIEIAVGVTNSLSLDNLQHLVANTGSDFQNFNLNSTDGESYRQKIIDRVEVTSKTATTLALRALSYGVVGNSYPASLGASGWSAASFGTSDLFASGTAGATPGPDSGAHRYIYTYYRSGDGAESAPSAEVSVSLGAAGEVDLAGLDDGPDADYDFKRVYRTLVSGVLFYRVMEVPDGTTTATDSSTDEDLRAFGSIPFDEEAFRGYYGGNVPSYRVVTQWQGRVWGGGAILAATYTRGDCALVNDSATVTMQNGAVVNRNMVGRRFRATNNTDAETYRIVAVSESGNTITLDRPYQDTSKDPAEFEIVDDRSSTGIGCSEVDLPNQWVEDGELGGITSADREGIVGVVAYGDALFWFCRDGIWRLLGESLGSWQVSKVVDGVGAYSQPEAVPGGMIWVGPGGVYAWSGVGEPELISSPRTTGEDPIGIDRTMDRVSKAHAHRIHLTYDDVRRLVRIFLPLDGDPVPRHALTLDMGTRGSFTLDDIPEATSSALVKDHDGGAVPLIGTLDDFLIQANTDVGTAVDYHFSSAVDQGSLAIPTKDSLEGDFTDTTGLHRFRVQKRGMLHKIRLAFFLGGDGAFGFEPVQTLTAGTVRLLTIGSSVWPTTGNGIIGLPCYLVRTSGVVERLVPAANTATTLTLARDLTSAAAVGDQVVVGAMLCDAETGRFDLGETRRPKLLTDVWVNHTPGAAKLTGFTLAVRAADPDDS